MTRALLLIAALSLMATALNASTINQNIGGGIGFTFDGGISGTGSGGTPPPTCSNQLDFSQACNSQYVAVIH